MNIVQVNDDKSEYKNPNNVEYPNNLVLVRVGGQTLSYKKDRPRRSFRKIIDVSDYSSSIVRKKRPS